jgi:hypothetical protein
MSENCRKGVHIDYLIGKPGVSRTGGKAARLDALILENKGISFDVADVTVMRK